MSLFSKLVCWFVGHEWETYRTYSVDVSPAGHGILRCRKCSRCKEEQSVFECTAQFGSAKDDTSIATLKPSNSRNLLDVYTQEQDNYESNDDIPNNNKENEDTTKACEPCAKKAQNKPKRNKSQVS